MFRYLSRYLSVNNSAYDTSMFRDLALSTAFEIIYCKGTRGSEKRIEKDVQRHCHNHVGKRDGSTDCHIHGSISERIVYQKYVSDFTTKSYFFHLRQFNKCLEKSSCLEEVTLIKKLAENLLKQLLSTIQGVHLLRCNE